MAIKTWDVPNIETIFCYVSGTLLLKNFRLVSLVFNFLKFCMTLVLFVVPSFGLLKTFAMCFKAGVDPHACILYCQLIDEYVRFGCGTKPADLLVASMAVDPLYPLTFSSIRKN